MHSPRPAGPRRFRLRMITRLRRVAKRPSTPAVGLGCPYAVGRAKTMRGQDQMQIRHRVARQYAHPNDRGPRQAQSLGPLVAVYRLRQAQKDHRRRSEYRYALESL